MPCNIDQEWQHPPIRHGVLQFPDRARRNPCFVSPASPSARVKPSKTFASPMPGLPVVRVRDDSGSSANSRSRAHRLHTGTTRRGPRQRHRGPRFDRGLRRGPRDPHSASAHRQRFCVPATRPLRYVPTTGSQQKLASDYRPQTKRIELHPKRPTRLGPWHRLRALPRTALGSKIASAATTGTGVVPGSKEFFRMSKSMPTSPGSLDASHPDRADHGNRRLPGAARGDAPSGGPHQSSGLLTIRKAVGEIEVVHASVVRGRIVPWAGR